MTKGRFQLLAGLIFLATAAPLLAQTYHGGLRGAVREAGAIVPGASITITNEGTNVSRSVVTNHAGEYAFVNVEPGTYGVKVSMQGFKANERRGLRIGTQQFLTMDFTLQVGSLEESVTVEAQASALESSNASVASSLDKATLETLPTAGRNAFFLAVTTPGVVPSGDPQFVRQQDQTNQSFMSLGGGPRRGNNYTLDGVSIVDMQGRATFIPNIESVDEVKVQVSTYDAELGRSGGGVFNTTGKSGANEWRGSLLYQNRPKSALGQLYFEKLAKSPKADTFFHLAGGSLGGPIVKNKTFFWVSTEGYLTRTTRNGVLTIPTDRELSGDFSQSGVTIYDPLNVVGGQRQPFPGNVIPANRISPVAGALRQYWPKAGGSATAELVDRADQATLKLDQRWSDRIHSSLMYGFYDSEEPASRFYGKNHGDNVADPSEGALLRQVQVVALNNTIMPNPSTVAHVRLGYTSFKDNSIPLEFDPSALGFSQQFLGQMALKKFTDFDIGDYGTSSTGDTFGDRDLSENKWYSYDANASMSKLLGRHTVKLGASFRRLGLKSTAWGSSNGSFVFNGIFTAANPVNAARPNPNVLADFLLGYPNTGTITVATPNDFFINYYAGYIQDDARISSNLTINFGLRYEFEQGLQETNNAFTVGFDRDRAWPFQVPGMPPLKGGLMYAGVDGYATHQSDPRKTKFAPRAGFAWSLNTETVVRGGYGLFYAPHQYAGAATYGTLGFTAVTDYVASIDGNLTPSGSLTNPFPAGIQQPRGSAAGILTGAGGTVNFVDQFRKSAYFHQFSVDVQRTLPGDLVLGLGYVGSAGRRLGIGGTASGTVNINQLDPRHLSLGSALLQSVPNPMFGDARFGAFGRQATITRGQLLRPYPQFGDLLAHQVSAGKSRYDSVVLRLERRIRKGWGARVNYTWSSNKDNLIGEANSFSTRATTLALNNYNLDAEYGASLLETPHRVNLTGTVELPFGKGKKWLSEQGITRVFFGGWSITVVGAYQSGFPVNVIQSVNNAGLLGNQQRPNVTGTDPLTSGGSEDRLNNWFNPAAWTAAPAFTLGNASRTDTRARTPFKSNTDIAFQKVEPLGGRKTLMLRAELINAFDDPLFLGPNTVFGTTNFGRITAVGGFPRMWQLMVRFAF